jgi:hypothetical protein
VTKTPITVLQMIWETYDDMLERHVTYGIPMDLFLARGIIGDAAWQVNIIMLRWIAPVGDIGLRIARSPRSIYDFRAHRPTLPDKVLALAKHTDVRDVLIVFWHCSVRPSKCEKGA